MDLADLVADYIFDLTDLDFRSYTCRYCVDIGLHYLSTTNLSYRGTKEELDHILIQHLFECLGKLYKHQRMDCDLCIDIYWENMH